MIQSLSFSFNEQYLASLGGPDDKNTMIVWDFINGKALYQSPLVGNEVHQIVFFNKSDESLLAVIDQGVQLLTIDKLNKKVTINLTYFLYFLLRLKVFLSISVT